VLRVNENYIPPEFSIASLYTMGREAQLLYDNVPRGTI
jgi:hypothetical protein